MSKVKLTKSELKRQKDALARFYRYLPILELKKQQLQVELNRILRAIEEEREKIAGFLRGLERWIGVFAEDLPLSEWLTVEKVFLREGNIAGVAIPVCERVEFKKSEYDFFTTPLWVDAGIDSLKQMLLFKVRLWVLEKQEELVREELKIITQRVNLFEKVKIPQLEENIRKIKIHLGDVFTAEVVRGKIAKKKLLST